MLVDVGDGGFQPDDVALVVGCGPIGLMTIQCARLAGAGLVCLLAGHDQVMSWMGWY